MARRAMILSAVPSVIGGTLEQMVEHAQDKNLIIYTSGGSTFISSVNDAANVTHIHGQPTQYGPVSVTSLSNAWSISVANLLTTAAQVTHSHGNISIATIAGTNATYSSASSGLTLSLPNWLTTAANSTHTHNYAGTGVSATGANVTMNSNGIAISVAGGTGGADGYNIIGAGTQTAGLSTTVIFANSNNMSFGMSGGSQITGSFSESTHPHPYLSSVSSTLFATSVLSSALMPISYSSGWNSTVLSNTFIDTNYASRWAGTTTAVTNVGLTVNSLGIRVSVDTAGLTAAGDGVNIIAAGSQTAGSTGTIKFVNSNDISFGMSDSTQVTASFSQSTHSHPYVNTSESTKYATSYLSGTFATTGHTHSNLYVNTANTSTLMPLANSTGYASSVLSASFAKTDHSHTQYAGILTTGITGGSATINNSRIELNIPSGTICFSDSNGVSFGSILNGGSTAITASVDGGNNITLGGNTTGTMASLTNGALTLAGGNNITISQVGNAFTLSGANLGGAQTGISQIAVSNTVYTVGSVTFSNANSVSFGGNSDGHITVSFDSPGINTSQLANYAKTGFTTVSTTGSLLEGVHDSNGLRLNVPAWITNAISSGALTGLIGTNTAQTNVTWTVNSSGISLNAGNYARTGVTTATTSGVNLAATLNTGGLNVGFPNVLTTAMQSVCTSVFAKTGFTSGTTGGALVVGTHDTNGLSMRIPSFLTTAVHTSQTGSVVFYNARGSNITFGSSSNSNSTYIYATAGGGTGGGAGAAIKGSGTYSQNTGTIVFQTGNGITFGLQTNGTMTASYTVPQGSVAFSNSGNNISWGSSVDGSSTTVTAQARVIGGMGNTATIPFTTGTIIFSGDNLTVNTSVNGVSQYIKLSAGVGGIAGIGNTATVPFTTGSVRISGANLTVNTVLTNGSQIMQISAPSIGYLYFSNANGHSWGSSVNGVSTSIYMYT